MTLQVTTTTKTKTHTSTRKWFGVVWLLIEVNLIGGTIFGFPALFKILPQYGIYGNIDACLSSRINETETEIDELSCERHQTRQYQVCIYHKIN